MLGDILILIAIVVLAALITLLEIINEYGDEFAEKRAFRKHVAEALEMLEGRE